MAFCQLAFTQAHVAIIARIMSALTQSRPLSANNRCPKLAARSWRRSPDLDQGLRRKQDSSS